MRAERSDAPAHREAWTVTGTHAHSAHRLAVEVTPPVTREHVDLRPMHTPAVHYALAELKPTDDDVGPPTGALVAAVNPSSPVAGVVQPGDVLVGIRTATDAWDDEPWWVEEAAFEEIVAAVDRNGTGVELTFERFPGGDVEPGEFLAGH